MNCQVRFTSKDEINCKIMSLEIDGWPLILAAAAHALSLMNQCQYLKVILCHLITMI